MMAVGGACEVIFEFVVLGNVYLFFSESLVKPV